MLSDRFKFFAAAGVPIFFVIVGAVALFVPLALSAAYGWSVPVASCFVVVSWAVAVCCLDFEVSNWSRRASRAGLVAFFAVLMASPHALVAVFGLQLLIATALVFAVYALCVGLVALWLITCSTICWDEPR